MKRLRYIIIVLKHIHYQNRTEKTHYSTSVHFYVIFSNQCNLSHARCREATGAAAGGEGGEATTRLEELTKQRTEELHQARVKEIQDAAQDAAMQDEALGLKEQHLTRLIDTLQEFSGVKNSPASGFLEQARQVK